MRSSVVGEEHLLEVGLGDLDVDDPMAGKDLTSASSERSRYSAVDADALRP